MRIPLMPVIDTRLVAKPSTAQPALEVTLLAFGPLTVDHQAEALLERELVVPGGLDDLVEGVGEAEPSHGDELLMGSFAEHGAPDFGPLGATNVGVAFPVGAEIATE